MTQTDPAPSRITAGTLVLVAFGSFAAGVTVAAAIYRSLADSPDRIVIERSNHYVIREKVPPLAETSSRGQRVPATTVIPPGLPQTERSSVRVPPQPDSSRIFWDGGRVAGPPTSFDVELDDADHQLRIERPGQEPLVERFRAEAGERVSVTIIVPVAIALFPTSPPQAVLAAVESTYKSAGSISGRFSETFVDKLRGRRRESSGQLWAGGRGQLRLDYEAPLAKYFIYSGSRAYFYEPEIAQVTVIDDLGSFRLSSSLWFLLDDRTLPSNLRVAECEAGCDFGGPNDVMISLWPTEPGSQIDHLIMAIDTQRNTVSAAVSIDPLRNAVIHKFLDMSFNTSIPDEKFQFTTPSGVSVLRASASQ